MTFFDWLFALDFWHALLVIILLLIVADVILELARILRGAKK